MKKVIGVFLLATLPITIFASNAQVEIQACWNKIISADQHECLADLDKKYDDKLNAVYKKLSIELEDKDFLVAAQRAWIKFRDAECSLAGSFAENGSLQPLLVDSTYAALTAKRIEQLDEYLRQQG